MESLFDNAGKKGVNAFDNIEDRLPARPHVSKDGSQTTRRKGKAVEDLGSSFAKGGASRDKGKAKTIVKRPYTRGPQVHDIVHSDSEDEMDCLSSSQVESGSDTGAPIRKNMKGKRKEQELERDDNGRLHQLHPKFQTDQAAVLRKLKFGKKTGGASDSKSSNASSSTSSILKEELTNRDRLANSFAGIIPDKRNNQISYGRARSLVPPSTYNRSPGPSRHIPSAHKTVQDRTTTENTRPKPRPLIHATSTQHKPQPPLDTGVLGNDVYWSRTRRPTVSQHSPLPLSLSESGTVDSTKVHKSPEVEKLVPAAFPQLSPVASPARASTFPSLTPLASPGNHGTAKKPSYQKTKSKTTPISPTTPKPVAGTKVKDASGFPVLSPLSSRVGSANGEGAGKSRPKQKDRLGYKRDAGDHNSNMEELQSTNKQAKVQPFPMSTQMLDSIRSPDSPPARGRCRLGKRLSSDGSDNEGKRKRIRKDKDGDMWVFLSYISIFDDLDVMAEERCH